MSAEATSHASVGVQFSLRACCRDAPAGVGFVEVAGAPGPLPATSARVVVETFDRPDYEADRPTAFHEIGHALVAIIAGARVLRVTLRDPNPLASCHDVPIVAHPVYGLAGSVAENLARGWIMPLSQDVVSEHLDIVTAPAGGNCDLCLALRPCVARAGLDQRDTALRFFREAERATVALLDHHASRRFLRIAASELLRAGELPGERVHEIAREVLAPETLKSLKKLIEMEA